MTINPKDWRRVKPEIIKQYKKKGLDKTLEFCVLSQINLMVAIYFILEDFPEDKNACKKLEDLLQYYKEDFKEEE